jgi:beta-glucosidase
MPVHIPGFSGGDRTDITLPAAQQQLLEAAKATGKPLVVVLMNGSALAVNWAQQNADAILEAWYPGEAGSQAIAETLAGTNNPAGRLPVTFYASLDQLPPFEDYAMANRTYRYFKGKPLYGFGYGLSYTSFAYSNLKVSTTNLHAGDTLTVEADVKNTGKRAGEEVAELYLTPPHTDVSPNQALDGFTRVSLAPGQTKHVTFTLDPRTISQVDDKGVRAVTPGSYSIALGGAQPSETTDSQTTTFTIEGTHEIPR